MFVKENPNRKKKKLPVHVKLAKVIHEEPVISSLVNTKVSLTTSKHLIKELKILKKLWDIFFHQFLMFNINFYYAAYL